MPHLNLRVGHSMPDPFGPILPSQDGRIHPQSDVNPVSANNPTIGGEIYFDRRNSRYMASSPELNERRLYIDVPDLQEDLYLSSPPSASSENMIITPPMPTQDGLLGHPLPPVSPASWVNVSNSSRDPWEFHSLLLPTQSSRSSNSGEKDNALWNTFPGKQPTSLRSSSFDDHDSFSINDKPGARGLLEPLAFSSPSEGCHSTRSSGLGTLPSSLSSAPFGAQTPYIPPPIPVPQSPIKLHQPRPSRYIPIISLSDLASACDSDLDEPADSPINANSSFDHVMSSPLDDISRDRTGFFSNWESDPYKDPSSASLHWRGPMQQVIKCSCGCMGAYLIH